eukprot:EG_transcript_29762
MIARAAGAAAQSQKIQRECVNAALEVVACPVVGQASLPFQAVASPASPAEEASLFLAFRDPSCPYWAFLVEVAFQVGASCHQEASHAETLGASASGSLQPLRGLPHPLWGQSDLLQRQLPAPGLASLGLFLAA